MATSVARKSHAQSVLASGLASGGDGLAGIEDLVISTPPRPVPSFTFLDAQGEPQTLADYPGKGIVLNFWATWCHPCVAELPALERMATRLNYRNIEVLALSSDRGGTTTVRHFYATREIQHLPVLLDPDMAVAHLFGVEGIPTTVLIDAQGRERARLVGGAQWDSPAFIERIAALIAPTDQDSAKDGAEHI